MRSPAEPTWRIWALRAGTSRMDRSLATYLNGMGTEITIPHTMFLLLGPSVALVDTSFESAAAVKRSYPQEISREPREEPLKLLAARNVHADDVRLIICTHLHYDHCGSNGLFRKARIVVQRKELEYALNPTSEIMRREFFSPAGGFTPPFDQARMETIDGDIDLGNGLRLLHLPGHTPGSQGVIVQTDRGRVGLLGDNVMVMENWIDRVPVGLHSDVDAWYRSIHKAKHEIDAVAPSHDLRLFSDDSVVARIA